MRKHFSERLRQAANTPVAAAGLALILGASVIGGRSFATDEAFSWGLVTQPDASSTWDGIMFTSGNMLVYLTILKGFAAVSESVIWLRLPSLLAFVATAALVHHVGRTWFDRRTGTIAGVLAASSVPLVYYGVETRSYAFVALTATATWYGVEKALRLDRRFDWWLLGLFAGLMVSSHVINVLALPIIAVIVLTTSTASGLGARAIRLVPIGVFVLPSAVLVAVGDESQTDWIPALGPSTIGRAARFLAGDHAQFTHDYSGFVLVAVYLALYAVALRSFLRAKGWQTRNEVLVWTWFLGLPVMVTLVSVVDPLLWHRYLIASLPGGLLVVAHTLAGIERRRVAVGIVVMIALLGTVRTAALRNHSADEFEALAVYVEENAEPADALAVVRPWTRVGLDYYWRDGAPVVGRPDFSDTFDHRAEASGAAWPETGSRIWLIDRADAGQVWVDQDRTADDFGFEEIEDDIPAGYILESEEDVQRFRVLLYAQDPER